MVNKIELMMEAERRGILPSDKSALLQEARKRGLVGDKPAQEAKVEQPQEVGLLGRIKSDLSGRLEDAKKIDQDVMAGKIGPQRAQLNYLGKVYAGGAADVVGETLVSGAKYAGEALNAAMPNFTKDIGAAGKSVGTKLLETDLGKAGLKAIKSGVEAWEGFKADNPLIARDIESVVNIGALVSPVKGKPKASMTGKTTLGQIGDALEQKAVNQQTASQTKFLQDLVRPKQTASVLEDQVGRTTEQGILKSKVIAPSPQEKRIVDELIKIPKVSNKNTLQGNYNAIAKEIDREANILKSRLEVTNVPYKKAEFDTKLNEAYQRILSNPSIVGDSEIAAKKIIDKMQQLLTQNKPSVSGLLEARKQLDSWVRSGKGKNIFDPKTENALSVALKEIRQTTNNFIDEKAVGGGVKESLRKQSALFDALENIAPKAAGEGNNAFQRLVKNTLELVPLKGQALQAAGLFGATGVASLVSPWAAPVILGAAGAYKLGKVATGPGTKKAVAQLLKASDEAIREAQRRGLKDVAKSLRADRILLLQAMKDVSETVKEEDQAESFTNKK